MTQQSIKNVVFDIGNVVVRWAPKEIIRLTFGEDADIDVYLKRIFYSNTWVDLNKGLLTEGEARVIYQKDAGLSGWECDRLFYYVKQTQLILHGSVELILKAKSAGCKVFALTDNVHEIVSHLQANYRFWPLFDGAVVSAEVGVLKPQAEIYQALLEKYQLQAAQTVFIDDMPDNVAGAKAMGMAAIQFKDPRQCETELAKLGVPI